MKKKKLNPFVCPGCGLPTIQEVEIWHNDEGEMTDFLAIHSRKLQKATPPNSFIFEVFEGCDRVGKLPR